MPLILAFLFLLAFVLLGARPYRVDSTLKTAEPDGSTYRSGAELELYAPNVVEKVKAASQAVWKWRPKRTRVYAEQAGSGRLHLTSEPVITRARLVPAAPSTKDRSWQWQLELDGSTKPKRHVHEWSDVLRGNEKYCVECHKTIGRY